MSWLQYLLEANMYLSVFYLCYCLFLNRETHYTLNRVYLLFSCVAAFIIPLLQIGLLKRPEAVAQTTATIIPGNLVYSVTDAGATQHVQISHFTLQDGLLYAYVLGVGIFIFLVAVKLYKLFRLSKAEKVVNVEGYKLISLNESNTAFSFFNYLFIGTKVPGAETIIKHELVHIRQKHSVDIVLLELLKIINWFNPLIYLLQNSLKTVHEYIADEQTVANDGDALTYSSFLVDNAYGVSGSSITHSFFNYNLLKKRIIMLNQQRSGNLARLKYLIIAPLCAGLLCVSTLAFSKTYCWVDLAPARELNAKNAGDTTFLSKPKTYTNEKGFIINEKYYAVNGKKYYKTIIAAPKGKKMPTFTNEGDKLVLYLGQGNASGEEMIYHNYGYKFPNVDVTPSKISPPPPPPMITADKVHSVPGMSSSRNSFILYASKHIVYPKAAVKSEITGTVLAKFSVDESHKIKQVTIMNSVGGGCDEQVINMLKSYPGPILGEYPDYYTAIVFELFDRTTNKAFKRTPVDPKITTAPNFIAGMGVIAYAADTKSIGIVVPPPPPPAPPKNKMDKVKFPPPIVVPDNSKPIADEQTPVHKVSFKVPASASLTIDTSKNQFEKLYKQLARTIRYPKLAKDNNYAGRVIAVFTVDADLKMQDVWIARSLDQTLNDETVRALKAANVSFLKPGEVYSIPISFSIIGKDGKYVDAKIPDNAFAKPAPHPGIIKSSISLNEIVVTSYK